MFAAIKAAIDSGSNFFNAGDFYGPPHNNSLTVLNKYFKKYPEDASKIVLSVKGGMDMAKRMPDGSKEFIKKSLDGCLATLDGVCAIDQWEPARRDMNVDYEKDTLATVEEYVAAGKIGSLGVSEVNGDTLRQAVKNGHKITCLETEVSLFYTDPLTNGTLAACAELGIPVLAYGAMGKGFLGGKLKSLDDLPEGDYLRHIPQFSPENFPLNLKLVEQVEGLAKRKGCTTGQIAINWLLAISKRPGMPQIIPLTGSSDPERIKENATIIDLTDEDLKEIDHILASFKISGDRYPKDMMTMLNK